MKYILTDIEGTTTSISFVHDILFPYSKNHLKTFMDSHTEDETLKQCFDDIKKTVFSESQLKLTDNDVHIQLLKWIEEDRKHPALKTIQGLIWDQGYKSQEIKGHVYEDVPKALEKWKKQGLQMGIYSSGSIYAQKLLFKHSDFGDLTNFFSNYFDTGVGHKREPQSYVNISKELNLNPEDILFLSDIKEELDAAKKIGMNTSQLLRLPTVITGDHKTIKSFLEI